MSISKIELFLCREIRNPHNTSHKLHYVMYYRGGITLLCLYIKEFFYTHSVFVPLFLRENSIIFTHIMSYLLQFLATAVALYFAAKYIPDISYTSSSALLVFVVVLAIANLTLGTVLRIITFPIKLITLGISSLVISVFMVYITDYFVTGISLRSIISIISVAVITSIIALLFRVLR